MYVCGIEPPWKGEGRTGIGQRGKASCHAGGTGSGAPLPQPQETAAVVLHRPLCGQSSFRGHPGKGVSVAEAIPGGRRQWGLGLLVFPAAGQHVPIEGAAQGPGLCVHHMPCSSSALQDLVKHSMMMHTMEFCVIVMKKDTTDEC